ncbi:MAG: hypothetical protein PHX30_05660 [Candidatus Pacebacteria bacterium]|jgi:hypothetical protein|nr:hypothetical protein [Candidatus Paceibacterota bacterium]
MDFDKIVSSISLTNPSWDLLVLLTFVVGIYFYLFRYGKDRAFLVLLCSYVSLALIEKLSLIKSATGLHLEENFTNKTALFLVGILVLSWIFSHSDFTFIHRHSTKKAWFQTLVVSFLQIGFIISIIISFLPAVDARNLSIFLKTVFVDNVAQLFWMISPFFAILLIKEK